MVHIPPIGRVKPVLYIPFFEGTIRDKSGYGNHGSFVGGAKWLRHNNVNGIVGGSGGRITVPHSALLDITDNLSIFAKCNLTGTGAAMFYEKALTSGSCSHSFFRTGTGQLALFTTGPQSTSPLVTENVITTCITSVQADYPRFFVNGAFSSLGNNVVSLQADATEAHIAGSNWVGYVNYEPVDLVLVYNAILTDDENYRLHQWAMDITSSKSVSNRRYWFFDSRECVDNADVCVLSFANSIGRNIVDCAGFAGASVEGPANIANAASGRGMILASGGYASVVDRDNLSFGDGSNDSSFSVEAVVVMDSVVSFPIVSKGVYNTSGEYQLFTDASGKLCCRLMDESEASCYIGRMYNSAITSGVGKQTHIIWTYNGNKTSGGNKLYIDGLQVDDTNFESNPGNYVAMENLASDLWVGRNDATYGVGKIIFMRIVGGELTAQQVRSSALLWGTNVMYDTDLDNSAVLSSGYTTGIVPGTDVHILYGTNWVGEDNEGKYLYATVNAEYALLNAVSSGTWDYKFVRGSTSINFMAIGSIKAQVGVAGQNGYLVYVSTAGAFGLYRITGASNSLLMSSATGLVDSTSVYTVRFIRDVKGKMWLYVKGGVFTSWTLITAVSGSNPATDNTYTTSAWSIVWNGAAGIKNYSVRRYSGLLFP